MEADPVAIRQFIQRVHGSEPRGWLVLWTRQDKITRSFDVANADQLDCAVDYCTKAAAYQDVYAAVGLQGEQPKNGTRGKEAGVVALPGVWADIDIIGPAHKATNLPLTESDAMSIVEAVGLPPSIIAKSGFGLQVYWLFREPFLIETESERQFLKSLSRRFQQMIRLQAQSRGWTIDSTSDLCRLLRLPGTFNRKIADDIRLVTAAYYDRTYCVEDIGDAVSGLDDVGPTEASNLLVQLPPAKLPNIVSGCAWMRHCRDDAAVLPEPEWYRMLSVIGRCENALAWAQEFSRSYLRYSPAETQRKLEQASGPKIAPVTCAYVESDLNGSMYCATCLFRGNINSPITLGRIDQPDGSQTSPDAFSMVAADPANANRQTETVLAAQIERFTDLGNAKRFSARYRNQLLYCDQWNRWLHWDGRRWREDETLEAFRFAGELVRSLYLVAKTVRDDEERKAFLAHLIRSESFRAQSAMLNLAKADSFLAVHPSDLDRDLWLLTVENGTLDLRTGTLQPHDQRHRITKLAPVIYEPTATCPHWLDFLSMVMNGNDRLISFLRRAFGYCLAGITSAKALFVLHGPGGDNGKSTMVDVIQMLMGDYAVRTPTETFLRKKEGSIPNDIAKLKGARFVWASEGERGSRLSESLIKEMTGGDKLSARFMRGEYFEFHPTFKLWLATNHKPQVRGDRALWNRIKLIPFDVSIPKEKQKPRHEVMAMFRAEFSGILNWALAGCLEWQRNGLGVPEEVTAATEEYESEQDTFAMFLEEKCVCYPSACELSLPLYKTYKAWAEQYGEYVVSHKVFSSLLAERGFKKEKTRTGILYRGVGLRSAEHYDMPPVDSVRARRSIRDQEEGEAI